MIVFSAPIEQFPQHLAFAAKPTATSEDPNFPASNLTDYSSAKVFRTQLSSSVISWDFGRSRKFNVISLVSTNTSYLATMRIEISENGTSWTSINSSPIWAHLQGTQPNSWVDEDADPRKGALERNSSWYYSQAGHSARYLRITVSDPLVANITIARLFVGRSYRPKVSYQYGSSLSFEDTGRRDRTDQGALILDPGRAIVGANVKMDFLSSDEMYDFIYDFNYWRQGNREIMTCLDVNTIRRLQKNLLYCTITEGRKVTADSFNAWSQTWVLESI